MGLETRKDKPKAKPRHKPKVAIVINKPESQEQYNRRIKEVQERLDKNGARREVALRRLGGNKEEVDTLIKKYTPRKFKFGIGVTLSLVSRGGYAFMLKRNVRVDLGKAIGLNIEQKTKLSSEPGKMSAELYDLGVRANVLGAVLGLKDYQQKKKRVVSLGYTLEGNNVRVLFLGQLAKTSGKTELSARLKFLKQLKQGKLFADIKLDKPGSPGLKNLGAIIGFKFKEKGTFAVSMSPGKPGKRSFYFSFIGELW